MRGKERIFPWPEVALRLPGSFLHTVEDDPTQEGFGVHAKWATSLLPLRALLKQPLDPRFGGGQQVISGHDLRA